MGCEVSTKGKRRRTASQEEKDKIEKREMAKLGMFQYFRALCAVQKRSRRLSWDQWLTDLDSCRTEKFEARYQLKEKIGEGRFAGVYKCTDKLNGQDYAVKVIEKKTKDGADAKEVRAEVKILRLSEKHPFIVTMKRVYETKKKVFIVMDFMEQGDLFKAICRSKAFDEAEAVQVVYQLGLAIQHCHQHGIVHKDIKPENLLVEKKEGDMRIYVTDFGLSQFAKDDEAISAAGGSICYMAPEMIDSDKFTNSVDIWGIGVITYVMLSGSLPFFDRTEDKLMDKIVKEPVKFTATRWTKVSPEAIHFVKQTLTKDPDRRPTIKQVLEHDW
ncbi:hypothetical protein AAMO2058_000508500 [Amorphochlora amoebiformis]